VVVARTPMKINPSLIGELHRQMSAQQAECSRINKLERVRKQQLNTPEADAIRAAIKMNQERAK